MFIRNGPYENATLRFQISFPDTYPRLPPLVTFSTDMFHPLITPLTTYMYTTDIQDSGTVSATDEERLPPGGFSLRHGFPSWFGRGGARGTGSTSASRQVSGGQQPVPATPSKSTGGAGGGISGTATPDSRATTSATAGAGSTTVSTYEVLRYIRSAFDDESVLDSIPLEAAGNPGAWHAWRTRQRMRGKGPDAEKPAVEPAQAQGADVPSTPAAKGTEAEGEGSSEQAKEQGETAADTGDAATPAPPLEIRPPPAPATPVPGSPRKLGAGPSTPATTTKRKPGEWNWEGVWEDRVKKGIAASLSESVLYGGAGAGDDLIHFLPMEENDVTTVKDNLLRTLGSASQV